jgi:ATP-dependent DNA helicase PIF1
MHCMAADVTGSRKTILIPIIQLCPPDPTIHLQTVKKQFPIKLLFAMTINNTQWQTLKHVGIYVLEFTHHSLIFPPWSDSRGNFPILFI